MTKTKIDVKITVRNEEKTEMEFNINHIPPNDLFAVFNTHASYILKSLRERFNEQNRDDLRSF